MSISIRSSQYVARGFSHLLKEHAIDLDQDFLPCEVGFAVGCI